ncbi:glycosyltransferase [Aestuariivirga litoralis]|uniref:Glycosyltransferase n=1 Tax=Aestuariivirga litoralis TaxID=2650924 RepID=A0A2W2BEU1_9HYPH|nr:glycosyltransferase [Aestuariivirga litoralis]PZF78784.1 glycosyltransferase [Aestuariivirga litoralis]
MRAGPDMTISVLTVCRNAEATIGRTIESFLAQDHPNKEMVLVDGASTDATVAIARGFAAPQIRILSEPDRGMYDALNKGLGLYTGDAVGVLNADDAYRGGSVLSRIAEALQDHDATHGDLDFHDGQGRVVRRWRGTPRPHRGFAAGWMPAHPTFYVRRQLAEAVGPFDTALATAADYEWMLRAIEVHRARLNHIPLVMVDMAMGGRSTASLSAHVRHNLEALAARRRWLRAGLVDWALVAKPASKLRQFAGVGRRPR